MIYNFDAINPLAHEWAHILADRNIEVTLVNHRRSINCQREDLEILQLNDFNPTLSDRYEFILLPWLPSRRNLVHFLVHWLKLGFPNTLWIDHNPVNGRDKEGLILKILRRENLKKFFRLIHGTNHLDPLGLKSLNIPHPIFLSAFENSKAPIKNQPTASLNLAFIGRLDEQKGLEELPKLTRMISEATRVSINWIIAGNNPNLNKVTETIEDLKRIPNVSVESHVYGKNCPDYFIEYALLKADFMIAPYLQVTASGSISLAIALNTETISLGERYPLGVDLFKGKLVHSMSKDNLVPFINNHLYYKNENKNKISKNYSEEKKDHNYACGVILLSIIENLRKTNM